MNAAEQWFLIKQLRERVDAQRYIIGYLEDQLRAKERVIQSFKEEAVRQANIKIKSQIVIKEDDEGDKGQGSQEQGSGSQGPHRT